MRGEAAEVALAETQAVLFLVQDEERRGRRAHPLGRRVMGKQHYLACLDLAGRACLVVGEGAMALEKVDGLAAAGAIVTRVAPDSYRASDLDGRWLVVAATSDDELNHR